MGRADSDLNMVHQWEGRYCDSLRALLLSFDSLNKKFNILMSQIRVERKKPRKKKGSELVLLTQSGFGYDV